jgi:hypothetical protein
MSNRYNGNDQYVRQQALNYTSFNYETTGKAYPENYGTMSGNFDNAGGSWGVIQYNWKSGTLQPLLKSLFENHPDVVAAAFTNTADYNTLYDVVYNRTTADQIAWGESVTYWLYDANGNKITTGASGHSYIEPWNTYFHDLGVSPEGQAAQNAGVQSYWNTANTWFSDFKFWSRRAYALCFDNAVQYGGMTTTCHTDILNFVNGQATTLSPEVRELRAMRYFAWRVCQDHPGTYYQSALDRRMAIANGNGIVYGGRVDSTPYDLIMEPAFYNTFPAAWERPRNLAVTFNIVGG